MQTKATALKSGNPSLKSVAAQLVEMHYGWDREMDVYISKKEVLARSQRQNSSLRRHFSG